MRENLLSTQDNAIIINLHPSKGIIVQTLHYTKITQLKNGKIYILLKETLNAYEATIKYGLCVPLSLFISPYLFDLMFDFYVSCIKFAIPYHNILTQWR